MSHEVEEKLQQPLMVFIKRNYKLILSFIIFFTALFGSFNEWVKLGLYISAYLLVATNVLKLAISGIGKGQMLDENFLMSIASIVAFGIGESAEGVAVMLFYAVGQLTEEYAVNRSKRSISSLLDLRPDYANLKRGFETIQVDPSEVQIGDITVIKPGERIPLDGIVIKGNTQIDAAMLTGESLPVDAGVDQEVYSGTINVSSVIEVRVNKIFADSAVSKILKMVQKPMKIKQKQKSSLQNLLKYIHRPLY